MVTKKSAVAKPLKKEFESFGITGNMQITKPMLFWSLATIITLSVIFTSTKDTMEFAIKIAKYLISS